MGFAATHPAAPSHSFDFPPQSAKPQPIQVNVSMAEPAAAPCRPSSAVAMDQDPAASAAVPDEDEHEHEQLRAQVRALLAFPHVHLHAPPPAAVEAETAAATSAAASGRRASRNSRDAEEMTATLAALDPSRRCDLGGGSAGGTMALAAPQTAATSPDSFRDVPRHAALPDASTPRLATLEFPKHLARVVAGHLTQLASGGGNDVSALYAAAVAHAAPRNAQGRGGSKAGAPPSVVACGRMFHKGNLFFRCATCGLDPTCVLCAACFKAQDHTGHDTYVYSSDGGGMCDCGDPEAWKRTVVCGIHGTCVPDACIAPEAENTGTGCTTTA